MYLSTQKWFLNINQATFWNLPLYYKLLANKSLKQLGNDGQVRDRPVRLNIGRIEICFLQQRRNVGALETRRDRSSRAQATSWTVGTGTVKWRRHSSHVDRTHTACPAALSLTPRHQQAWQLKTAATHSRLGQRERRWIGVSSGSTYSGDLVVEETV